MVLLQIYITAGCQICSWAQEMAADVQASLPFVTVELLDLRTCTDVPDNVFATPTYLLNGNVISLGNPARGELFDRLVAARQTVGV